jgi:hypothetical protein
MAVNSKEVAIPEAPGSSQPIMVLVKAMIKKYCLLIAVAVADKTRNRI